ncbi:hypothetical protein IAS59_001664 [Cryptococcus gattii]
MEVGEISSHIWFTNATEDDILEKYAQFLGIGPAMLMYYNDALSLAALVLAPLRVLLEIVLANHEPPDEVEGIFPVSACNKTDDNTVYGAVARYGSLIHRHAMDVKHINISNVRQIFPQILSAANICDEINVALKLDNDNYDKEADGGFKTEVTASLNVPLNERNLFNQDKTNFMASKLDEPDGLPSDIDLSDLPNCLPSFLFSWPPQNNGDNRASFLKSKLLATVLNLGPAFLRKKSQYGAPTTAQRSKATGSSIATIMYAPSIVSGITRISARDFH